MDDIHKLKDEEQRGVASWCCCLPTDAAGKRFWGLILLIFGGLWLLQEVGIFVIGFNAIWPLLLIVCGLFWLGVLRNGIFRQQ